MVIFLPFVRVRVIGIGPILILFLTLPTPLGSLSEHGPAFSIGAFSGLDPGWGQVVRLVASFYQPLLVVGHIQPILILHLISPGGLGHRGTLAPPGVRRPCLETRLPLRTNTNQGRRRMMGAQSKRRESPVQHEDHGA